MKRACALLFASTLVLAVGGCKKKGSGGNGGGGGAWLVGQDGTMLQVPAGSRRAVDGYSLQMDHSLLSIACYGQEVAWVVGEQGTLLRTFDSGASWEVVELGTTATLRSVAAAGPQNVFIAGDGVFLVSSDAGTTWTTIDAPAAHWTSVAVDAGGNTALLTSKEGLLYRYDAHTGALDRVYDSAGVALNSVALTRDGQFAAAVGAGGLLLWSNDGGRTFVPHASSTKHNLLGVQVTSSGSRVIAVGDAGVFVRADIDGRVRAEDLLGPGLALRGVHLFGNGAGMIVGDDGTVLRTTDDFDTTTSIDAPSQMSLYGLDDLGGD